MTVELTILTLATLLAVVQFILYAVPANRDMGPGYTLSARDRPPWREMTPRTARLGRAFDNHMEWLVLFAIAVGVIQMAGENSTFTEAYAWVYLMARVAYVPAYVFGLRPWRSLVWAIGFGATTCMLLAALI